MVDFATDCTSNPFACDDLPNTFPVLPIVDDLCAIGVCEWLQSKAREFIAIVGFCPTFSVNFGASGTVEGSLTYCVVRDRQGRYGETISFGIMAGLSFVPLPSAVSTGFGAMVGLYFDGISSLFGPSYQVDITNSASNYDINGSGGWSGTVLMFSPSFGDEVSITAGSGLTIFARETPGPRLGGRLIDNMAEFVWG